MKQHLKRLAAPKTWAVKRKTSKFITRPLPGGHTLEMSMSVSTILRDLLKVADTARESKMIVKNKNVLVDSKKVVEPRYPVGIMDSLTLADVKQSYRMLITQRGKLYLAPSTDAEMKVCRVSSKTLLPGGKMQIGLHDGRSMIVTSKDYSTGDSVLIKTPSQELVSHIKLEKKAQVYMIGGKHIGKLGIVEDVLGQKLVIKIGSDVVETLKKFAIVIGKEKILLDLKV